VNIPLAVTLFSPKYEGNEESWHWICERSNGRQCQQPVLNEKQYKYAQQAGYLDELPKNIQRLHS